MLEEDDHLLAVGERRGPGSEVGEGDRARTGGALDGLEDVRPGTFARVELTEVAGYDLVGRIVDVA